MTWNNTSPTLGNSIAADVADISENFQHAHDSSGNVDKVLGGSIDANGTEVILDADGDTTITADTDDQIDIKIAGSDEIVMTATGITANGHGLLEGDTTAGRVLRQSKLTIEDGTNAATLKCTLENLWNGDAIAETDNIGKDATTGSYTLSSGGTILTIEAAGLSGNVVAAWGCVWSNTWGNSRVANCYASSNDIIVIARGNTGEADSAVDMTGNAGVDDAAGGVLVIQITYITSA